jgi:hypothetical protein
VPGWHAKTESLRRQGKLQVLGIIEEQHPDRSRLFMQWKQMDWPILVDSLNLLEVAAVPITVLIDEHGIVRAVRPSDEDLETFVEKQYPRPAGTETGKKDPTDLDRLRKAAGDGSFESLVRYAQAQFLWGKENGIDEAIDAYQTALEKQPTHGPTHFRLGVAYRKRFDSNARQPADFQKAVEHWGRALDLDPNQYIWRRRIEQYGPRLDKPYSFYDWVHQARQDIVARGETPVPLVVEPGGAEFAFPAEEFERRSSPEKEPDPKGRILRDSTPLIRVETTVVPAVVGPGESARAHVVFRPNKKAKGHWNNEVDRLLLWVTPPEGWEADRRRLTAPLAPEAVSEEPRTVEFEVKSPQDFTGTATIASYALYYICEDVNGTCLYRRQDIPVEIQVRAEP